MRKRKFMVDKQFKYYNIIMLKISQCKNYNIKNTNRQNWINLLSNEIYKKYA